MARLVTCVYSNYSILVLKTGAVTLARIFGKPREKKHCTFCRVFARLELDARLSFTFREAI
jgi:hypothetical protein